MADQITNEVLAEIVGIAADAIICMDASQRVTFFNDGAEKIFGWTAEEIVGQRIEVLLPERYRAGHENQVAAFGRSEVKARRMGERREISGLRKSGEEFPAEAAISQVHQAGITIYAVVLRDVTVRKRYQEHQSFLVQAGEKLASAFGSETTLGYITHLAVARLADGCILEKRRDSGFVAGSVAHVRAEIETLLWTVPKAGVRSPGANHPLSIVARTRAPVVVQEDAMRKISAETTDATYREALIAMKPKAALYLPLIARGELIGALSLFRESRGFDRDEISFAEDLARLTALAMDNARLPDEVWSSLRARNEMIGIVSHDLRNPVAAVKMLSAAVLRAGDRNTEANAENIALMCQAAEQMDALIRDLLDVSRLDAGGLRVDPEAIDARELIVESLKTLAPLAEEQSIHFVTELPASLPKVLADRERIQQALSNLVGNAIKFTPAGGTITVRAETAPESVEVSISDTGKGISPDDLPRVFERYWQSDRTVRHGAGLGLPIAKGIVEAHGGRIWIESSADAGTRVTFELPIAS